MTFEEKLNLIENFSTSNLVADIRNNENGRITSSYIAKLAKLNDIALPAPKWLNVIDDALASERSDWDEIKIYSPYENPMPETGGEDILFLVDYRPVCRMFLPQALCELLKKEVYA